MRRALWLALALLAAAPVSPASAQTIASAEVHDETFAPYAVGIVKTRFLERWTGYGIYLGRGIVITAAHVVGQFPVLTHPRVLVGNQELSATIVKEGSADEIDLALLAVDEASLPMRLALRQTRVCHHPGIVGQGVVIVDLEGTARSRVLPPRFVPAPFRRKYETVVAKPPVVGQSGAGVFDPTAKCLLGIITRAVQRPSMVVSSVGPTVKLIDVAATGPGMNDINQGYLGDCYFLASLAEVADQNAAFITSMFTDNGNGSYGVRFYENGAAQYVTVNSCLANGGTEFNHASDLWASLAEKGYAQLQAGGVVTGNSVNYGNSWSTIGNGGWPADALEEITGASQITNYSASGTAWNQCVYNSCLAATSSLSGLSTSTVLNSLVNDLGQGYDLVLTSYTNATDSSGKTTLVANHALSIYGYDTATGMLQIRNPWGTASGQSWDTTFEVSLSTLLAAGDIITVDNGTASVNAPVVTAQTATQTWKLGQTVSFALAGNTFTDPQGQTLTYSATWPTAPPCRRG